MSPGHGGHGGHTGGGQAGQGACRPADAALAASATARCGSSRSTLGAAARRAAQNPPATIARGPLSEGNDGPGALLWSVGRAGRAPVLSRKRKQRQAKTEEHDRGPHNHV